MIKLYKDDLPDDFDAGSSVAIDTEAMGLNIRNDRLCVVQLSCGNGDAHIVQISQNSPGNEMRARSHNLVKLLQNESVQKIFHFARFDVALLNYSFGIHVKNIYCTKIASKLARTFTERHGLKNLCRELLKQEISKNEQTSDWGAEHLTQQQLSYAANDVLHLHKLQNILNAMLMRDGKMEIALRAFETLSLICAMDVQGVDYQYIFNH